MEMPSADFSANRSQMLTQPRKIEKTCRELAIEYISFAVVVTL